MRLTTSHPRPANRRAIPALKPRNRVVRALVHGFRIMTGQRRREAQRAIEHFKTLDFDQRVREIGEW